MGKASRGLILLLALLSGAWAGAQPAADKALEEGAQAYARGDYGAAFRHWRVPAQSGDADAQFALGTLYQTGHGVLQSDAEASAWFRRAAEQGSVPAQYNLGNAYKYGRGVPVSDSEAFRWWRKAAEAGLAPAQFNIGTAYLFGRGVGQSTDQGLAWYRKAAANGHAGAQASLKRLSVAAQSAADTPVYGPEWVRAQPARHFTVQLLAAEDEAAARRFVTELPRGEYAVCPYRSKGRRWYAVLSGSYADAAHAQRAARLWREQRQPWVRKFEALQASMIP